MRCILLSIPTLEASHLNALQDSREVFSHTPWFRVLGFGSKLLVSPLITESQMEKNMENGLETRVM